MNILKSTLSLVLLIPLLGCGSDDDSAINSNKEFNIKGAFGITLGAVSKDQPEGYIIENKAISFIPDEADKRFVEYKYSITPKSHVIYGVVTKSSRELSKEECLEQRKKLIEKTQHSLGESSRFKITEQDNKWKIREANQRQITIDCEVATSPEKLQLVRIHQDTSLSLLAYKEWRKRQKEITPIRF